MAIVITDGKYYVRYTDTGATKKTVDFSSANQFATVNEAIIGMKQARKKTKNFYVYNTTDNRVLWKWMTKEEIEQIRRDKQQTSFINRENNGKIKRKVYSRETRRFIYNKANGCCELCGKKLLFEDMTIDHVIPLSVGGLDSVDNLSCVCLADNRFKSNILPDDFMDRITEIYLYQMEKKYKSKLKWKIIHRLLKKLN